MSAGAVPSRCVKLYSNKIVNFSVLARADTGPMWDEQEGQTCGKNLKRY